MQFQQILVIIRLLLHLRQGERDIRKNRKIFVTARCLAQNQLSTKCSAEMRINMKKGDILEGCVTEYQFPNKGIVQIEDQKIIVKNGLLGQKIRFCINKKRKGKCEGRLLEVLEPSKLETRTAPCEHFGKCGGCTYQTLSYEAQLKLKETMVRDLLDKVSCQYEFAGTKGSPMEWEYRNKMEFSFGDEQKDGPLALGLHKKGSMYDIVNTDGCCIVNSDFTLILKCVLDYFRSKKASFYHKMTHKGYLRHLLIRRGVRSGEMTVSLVTSSQLPEEGTIDLSQLVQNLLNLPLEGTLSGILHITNDSLADVVQSDKTEILYGQDYFYEELLGLKFKISVFSFFQPNTLSAEILYNTVREFVGNTKDKTIFDLYSGTGTIAQVLAPVAKKVIGVEIVEEAVLAARENARLNGLTNCEFIAGDVLTAVDQLLDKPDFIVLDPPRDGIHPKAIHKIINFGVEQIVYVSCKPTSLARDLAVFKERGYHLKKVCIIDQFPETVHVETVALLVRKG